MEVARFKDATDLFSESTLKGAFESAYRKDGYESFEHAGIVGGRQAQIDILTRLIKQRSTTMRSIQYKFEDESELKTLNELY